MLYNVLIQVFPGAPSLQISHTLILHVCLSHWGKTYIIIINVVENEVTFPYQELWGRNNFLKSSKEMEI